MIDKFADLPDVITIEITPETDSMAGPYSDGSCCRLATAAKIALPDFDLAAGFRSLMMYDDHGNRAVVYEADEEIGKAIQSGYADIVGDVGPEADAAPVTCVFVKKEKDD